MRTLEESSLRSPTPPLLPSPTSATQASAAPVPPTIEPVTFYGNPFGIPLPSPEMADYVLDNLLMSNAVGPSQQVNPQLMMNFNAANLANMLGQFLLTGYRADPSLIQTLLAGNLPPVVSSFQSTRQITTQASAKDPRRDPRLRE